MWIFLLSALAFAGSSESVICDEARALLSPETTSMAAYYSRDNEDFKILICPGKKASDCLDIRTDNFQYPMDAKQFRAFVRDANELGCNFPENASTLDLSSVTNRKCLANAVLLYRPDYHFDRHALHKLRTEANLPKEKFNQDCLAELSKSPVAKTIDAFMRVITGKADDDDPRVASEQEQKAVPATAPQQEGGKAGALRAD